MNSYPHRGDVYYAFLDPVIGCEQGGTRPVLILQNNAGNKHSDTVIVAAVTSRQKNSLPVHAPIPESAGTEEGSVALLEQLRTIDKSRLRSKLGHVDGAQMKVVDAALATSLGMRGFGGNFMLLTLCRACHRAFQESGGYLVIRADPNQEDREPCTLCGVRHGYDYRVIRK